MRVTQIFIFP